MYQLLLAHRYIDAYVNGANPDMIQSRLEELISALEVIVSQDVLYSAIKNPVWDPEKKLSLMKDNLKLSPECTQLFKVLFNRQRQDIFEGLLGYAKQKLSQVSQTISVEVESVLELSDQSKSDINTFLEKKFNKKINASYRLNASLLAGFRVLADGFVVEGSAQHVLDQFKATIVSDKRR